MNLNPICHSSPAKKMKCSFFDYVQLLIISLAVQWTQNPSATPLQSKKWNAYFWIIFNFWWSAGLVERLEPHPPPLSTPKNEMLIFGLRSTSDDWPGWSMDSNPIHHSSPAKKNKMLIFGLRSILMICLADWWTWTSSATPSYQKNEMLNFGIRWTSAVQPGWSMDSNPIHHPSPANKMKCSILGLCSNSDHQLGWLMDSNPICHPSPAKKMKCSFLDFVQLLMISQAGQ